MKKIYKLQFISLIIILFGTLSYKTYEQYINIYDTQKLLTLNESESLATFIEAFRSTYQGSFINNHIEVTDKTMKLLPVQTIGEISQRFSSSLHGDIIIRTVSDRPRNSANMANNLELEMINFYKKTKTSESRFLEKEGGYYYTKPLYITPLCMKCHGKREDAIPSIREKYEKAYDYKLGDVRGLLSIEIKKREYFSVLYDNLREHVIISIFMFLALSILIYLLIRKISYMEDGYRQRLEDELSLKAKELEQQNTAFETLFEKSMQGTLILKDAKFTQCNIAIVRMLRYSSKREVLNLHPSQLSPEFQPDGESSFDKANEMMRIAIEKGGHSFEWVHLRSDKTEFWVYVTLTPMTLSDGEIIHVSWRDISKRKALKEQVERYTKDLELRNEELDSLVQEEVQKNKKQQEVLFEQSRMAQMGELISMIAHQWRQPLSAISATSLDLSLKLELDSFDIQTQTGRDKARDYFSSSLNNIDALVQNLTLTLDDFRNFYKPNKQRKKSLIHIPMQKAYKILESTLYDVKIVEKYDSIEILELYETEFMQVIINIIQNAKDNFTLKGTKNASITINTWDTQVSSIMSICDNGGGIDPLILAKIFDPYFSTKNEKNGTGLGLYMCKTIIQEHHNGRLTAENTNDGVCFKIELFKKDLKNGN